MGLVKITEILRQGGQVHIDPGFKCLERVLELEATDEPLRRDTERNPSCTDMSRRGPDLRMGRTVFIEQALTDDMPMVFELVPSLEIRVELQMSPAEKPNWGWARWLTF